MLTSEAAEEMAAGAARLLGSEVALATSGVAGPDDVDGVEPGTVFVGWWMQGTAGSSVHLLDGEPADVCASAACAALTDLADALGSASSG